MMLQTVRYVDLDDNDTQQGVGYIATQGLIAPNRITEILADAKTRRAVNQHGREDHPICD